MFNKTSNPKFGKVETVDCSCLHGEPYLENGVCKCTDQQGRKQGDIGYETGNPVYATIRNGERAFNLEKVLAQLGLNNTGTTPTTGGTENGFAQMIAENKWWFIGGAAVLGYLFLSGGLAASERTVTSVTRFAPKSRK